MLKVKLLTAAAKAPTVAHPGEDLGYDVYAAESLTVAPQSHALVPTGIAIECTSPAGEAMGALMRDKSSLASRRLILTGGVIDAGYRENAQDSGRRHCQQNRASRGQGLLVRVHHDAKPGGIAKPGPGHVDHERRGPARGCFRQRHPEPVRVGGVDLLRHGHDRHAPEHVNRKPDLNHRSHLPRAEHRPAVYY